VIPNPVELSNAFTQIAKQVEPSVVNISVTYAANDASPAVRRRSGRRRPLRRKGNENGGGMDDFLPPLHEPVRRGRARNAGRRGKALGSGVVVDKAGYILTNNHVVDKADRIR
jgi:serine protease Do